MYAKKLQSVLDRKKLKVGDRILVEKDGRSYEGLLMPRVPRARRALLIASHSPHTLSLADIDSRSSCRPDSVATILTHETTP